MNQTMLGGFTEPSTLTTYPLLTDSAFAQGKTNIRVMYKSWETFELTMGNVGSYYGGMYWKMIVPN